VILLPRVPGPGGVAARLVSALEGRGRTCEVAAPGPLPPGDLLLCPSPGEPACEAGKWLAAHPPAAATRLLVVTRLGTHPDARSLALREAWALEEAARATGLPALVFRSGPLLGPSSPLWLRLRAGPGPGRDGTRLLNPVAEEDLVETLLLALDGRASWEGWYEVAGPEVWSLAELVTLARETGPRLRAGSGAWEPPLEEMRDHRLAESAPWLEHFGLHARPLAGRAKTWAVAPAGSAT